MRSLWHERYADMRSAALQWQLTTGQFNTRPYPELWRHDAETQAAFRGYAEAARILLRTPAPLMEALRWKKRSGTPDILPAEEVAAIIAADEAWLEAVNGKKRLARIARH